MRMAECPNRDVEPGETRCHLRTVAADAGQMNSYTFVQQVRVYTMDG